MYQSQPQFAETALWEALQKPQPNNSKQPQQHLRFIEPWLQQTRMEPPERQQFQLPQKQPRFNAPLLQKAVMEPPQREQQQRLRLSEPQQKQIEMGPPRSYYYQPQPLGFNKNPVEAMQKQLPNTELSFGNHYSQLPQQHLRFIESHTEQAKMEPPQSQPSQQPQKQQRFNESLLQKSSLEPPQRLFSELSQQQLRLNDPQLKETDMGQPQSSLSQPQHLGFNMHPIDQRSVQPPDYSYRPVTLASLKDTYTAPAVILTPVESEPQQQVLCAPPTINRDKVASKHRRYESETNSDEAAGELVQYTSIISQNTQLHNSGLPGIQENTVDPAHYEQDRDQSHLTFDTTVGEEGLIGFLKIIKAGTAPGGDLPKLYGESDEPMFDIPFFTRNTGSSSFSTSGNNLDVEAAAPPAQVVKWNLINWDAVTAAAPAPVIDLNEHASTSVKGTGKGRPKKVGRKPRGSGRLKEGKNKVNSILQIKEN